MTRWFPPFVLAGALLAVYLKSMAPGLTWAHYGADGGDLITAAAVGGVAHPTGYPLYLLLARGFQMLPIGSLAYRTNLLSAFSALLAVLTVYFWTLRSLSQERFSVLAALASALTLGLAPLFWSQAIIGEVYTLHVLLVALALAMFTAPQEGIARGWRDFLLGLGVGLALTNHVTSIFLLPIVVYPLLAPRASVRARIASAGFCLLGMAFGLTLYAILPWRARFMPPVNWGNPTTWQSLGWLVSGALYRSDAWLLTWPAVAERLQSLAGLALQQFGISGLLLGLTGLIVFFTPSRLTWTTLWIASTSVGFALVYASQDWVTLLLPAILCFAIWIGVGVSRLTSRLEMRLRGSGRLLMVAFLAPVILQAISHWNQVDASHDLRAENFGRLVMGQSPENSIIVARGDQAIFALWYYHFALQERPDIMVIAADLLPFSWYQETLQAAYPSLELPGPLPSVEGVLLANPWRPVCYVQSWQGDPAFQIECQREGLSP